MTGILIAGCGPRALRNEVLAGRTPDNPWEIAWLYQGIETRL